MMRNGTASVSNGRKGSSGYGLSEIGLRVVSTVAYAKVFTGQGVSEIWPYIKWINLEIL